MTHTTPQPAAELNEAQERANFKQAMTVRGYKCRWIEANEFSDVAGFDNSPAHHAWNGWKVRAAIAAAAPQPQALPEIPTAINWTPDGDKQCGYNNWLGETPFGRILITWKGWKESPDASVDEFPGGFTAYGAPDEVKAACEAEFRTRAALASQPVEPAERWLPIESAPKDHLVDIFAYGKRYNACHYDRICSEFRHITHCGVLIRLSGATHWMEMLHAPPAPPSAPALARRAQQLESEMETLNTIKPEAMEPTPRRPADIIGSVWHELERAIAKFPTWPTDPLHAVAVLGEEFGELTKDVLQMTYEPGKTNAENVRKEAIQTAAMALRFVASLDAYIYKAGEQHRQEQWDAQRERYAASGGIHPCYD